MRLFLNVFVIIFFLAGCNHNFYQAKKLEKEGKFEEASIEYSRVYFKYINLIKKNPNKCVGSRSCLFVKYKKAYEKNALKVIPVLIFFLFPLLLDRNNTLY